MSIFGSKDIRDAWYSMTGFGLIFEVTDDPNNQPKLGNLEESVEKPFKKHIKEPMEKPIEVWILPWSEGNDAEIRQMDAKKLQARKLIFCGSITKNTLPEHRMWSVNTFQEGWVSVIAAPTIEWNSYYTFRVYPAIKVVPGFRGNFAISIPRISDATTPRWRC